jgi:hypothetical protein
MGEDCRAMKMLIIENFKTVLILLFWIFPVFSQTLDATWNPSVGAKGYKLHWGTESRNYTDYKTTNDTQVQVPISKFERERTYFFTLTAFNDSAESGFGEEVSLFIPTGIEESVIDFKECDKIETFNILGDRVEFNRHRLPSGIYIHRCWLGNKVVGIKSEGLLK